MKRNNHQKGVYSKSKGSHRELLVSKELTYWARKTHGRTVKFSRTYSSGASANMFINPSSVLLGDVFCIGLKFPFEIEVKDYGSTSLRRYFEGTKRLSSWLEENTRDCIREPYHCSPLLITHIDRYGDTLMLPYQKDFFIQMNEKQLPCWSTYESYIINRTEHRFWFHVIFTDFKSVSKCMSIDRFIKDYKNCDWNKLNKKYAKYLTPTYLQSHSRAEMSKAMNPVDKAIKKAKK